MWPSPVGHAIGNERDDKEDQPKMSLANVPEMPIQKWWCRMNIAGLLAINCESCVLTQNRASISPLSGYPAHFPYPSWRQGGAEFAAAVAWR